MTGHGPFLATPSPAQPSPKAPRRADLAALIPRIEARARRLCTNPAVAEDLAQDCILRLWPRLARGDVIDDLEAYAMITLRHLSISRWRQSAPHEELQHDTLGVPCASLPRLVLQDVLCAIEALPPEQAVLMRATAQGETSPADLAKAFALPKGTVMSRLARARASLRLALKMEASDADLF